MQECETKISKIEGKGKVKKRHRLEKNRDWMYCSAACKKAYFLTVKTASNLDFGLEPSLIEFVPICP